LDSSVVPELVASSAAARIAAKSARTLRRLAAQGKLVEYRDENRRRYYDVAELIALRPRHVVAPAPAAVSARSRDDGGR
jgi:hypothetical protein